MGVLTPNFYLLPPIMLAPEKQRGFALDCVRRLRGAGFEAYWAGGCVRDQLLGTPPKDYDVATNAAPEQIRALFGRRRTLAIGAAFGVITVLGPRGAGQVEVTTFRQDAPYSDGRHPDRVTFTSAEADASRRDFTINGLFYDPVGQQVIDFVGGQEDLRRRVIRAIGQPDHRFGEDKLRMLRAVRFAARLEFELEPRTAEAVRQMAPQITVVSPERLAMEMRLMLVDPHRATAVRLLLDTALAPAVLPEIVPQDDGHRQRLEHALAMLDRLRQPGFPLALAVLLHEQVDTPGAEAVCSRWRLSNKETARVVWLVEHHAALAGCRSARWSAVQPLAISAGIEDLLALEEARRLGSEDAAHFRSLLAQPRQTLDPPPLVTGDDLLRHGVRAGPQYKTLLQRIRDAQLDGEVCTRDQAMELADRLVRENAGE